MLSWLTLSLRRNRECEEPCPAAYGRIVDESSQAVSSSHSSGLEVSGLEGAAKLLLPLRTNSVHASTRHCLPCRSHRRR